MAKDDYVYTLDYIANSTANGVDANGNAITGYKWWNFAYPTLATTGANAIANFSAAPKAARRFKTAAIPA